MFNSRDAKTALTAIATTVVVSIGGTVSALSWKFVIPATDPPMPLSPLQVAQARC